jgi:hypothetical protein
VLLVYYTYTQQSRLVAEDLYHLITPEERLRVAMARQ